MWPWIISCVFLGGAIGQVLLPPVMVSTTNVAPAFGFAAGGLMGLALCPLVVLLVKLMR